MKKFLLLFLPFLVLTLPAQAQFDRADSLRGALNPKRSCYDVKWYDLRVKVDPVTESIKGSNVIQFQATEPMKEMQLDLFANMNIEKITLGNAELAYRREHNAVFVTLPNMILGGEDAEIKFEYSGRPTRAKNAPWDGGFVWSKDRNGKPWIGVACEGFGASCWWPLKDHLSDEPDSMRITLVAPDKLMAVANGQLRSTRTSADAGYTEWEWAVTYPINSYNVTLNIADYAHIHDTYNNASGTHDLDYYVLSYNKTKAEAQFKQVKEMMDCYEKFFGEYPFWRDGYALVETPYLGMEHQGAIAYGNNYLPGYAGFDPLGLGFDYIVIHETGHEWWGNSVSTDDHAELWIHESFCTYGEAIYVECKWNYETALDYLAEQKDNIMNLGPIVGPRDVNFDDFAGSDMYYKGAWMLHTLRNCVDNDELWFATVKKFANDFKYKITNTAEVIKWFNAQLGKDYTAFFRQYLYHAPIPVLEYKLKKKGKGTEISYRFRAQETGFTLPIKFKNAAGEIIRLNGTQEWQKAKVAGKPGELTLNVREFYFKPQDTGK